MVAPQGEAGPQPGRDRRRRFRSLAVLVVFALVASGVFWYVERDSETTDDAFVEADAVRIAPLVGGTVVGLHFDDNQSVREGDALLEIDPRDPEAAAASAEANLQAALGQSQAAEADLSLTHATTVASIDQARNALEQAKHLVGEAHQQADGANAEVVRTALDVKRYEQLILSNVASQQRLDQAVAEQRSANARWRAAQMAETAVQAQVAQAEARLADANAAPQRIAVKEAQLAQSRGRVEQARAALQTAKLTLSYTRVAAPRTGRIARRSVRLGDMVQKNQDLAVLVVDPPWVVANFKETQLTRMRPGQPVRLRVDAFPDHPFRGRVDSFQAGTGARFSILPPENATGNYVKVVQRVPVKIVFDDPADPLVRQLGPGMSVVPVVDVGSKDLGNNPERK